MIFKITRTSEHSKDAQPCKGAYQKQCKCCKKKEDGWFINMAVSKLMKFSDDEGHPVIVGYDNDENPTLEIYDDHRE